MVKRKYDLMSFSEIQLFLGSKPSKELLISILSRLRVLNRNFLSVGYLVKEKDYRTEMNKLIVDFDKFNELVVVFLSKEAEAEKDIKRVEDEA